MLESRDRADRMVDLCRKAAGMTGASRNVIAEVGATESRANLGQHAEQYRHFRGWSYCSISAIAKKIAGQTIHVSRPPSGSSPRQKAISDPLESLASHPLLSLIASPNPWMVGWSLLYSTVASLEITGLAYWWFLRDDVTGGYQIFPIPSSWIEPADTLRTSWLIRLPGSVEPIPQPGELVARFSLPDPSNPFGSVSPLQAQAPAIVADETLQRSQNIALDRGINPSVILKAGRLPDQHGHRTGQRPILTSDQRQQLVNSILQAYGGGVAHSHKPFIVDGIIDEILPFSKAPREMDFRESTLALKSRILQSFGVNPISLGEIEGANRASAAVAQAAFAENVVNPLIEMLSQTMTRYVGPLFASPAERLVIWIEPMRASDPELTLSEWQTALAHKCVTKNEFRRVVFGLPPLPGGDEIDDTPADPPAPTVPKSLTGLLDRYTDPYTLKPFDLPTAR
jgi:phage portal protein BeeE